MPKIPLILTYLAFIVVLCFYTAPPNLEVFPIEKRKIKNKSKIPKKTYKQKYTRQYQTIAEQLLFISFIERYIANRPRLKNIKDHYIRRISITNSISQEEATIKVNQWISNSLFLGIASFVITFIFLKVAIISIVIAIMFVYFYLYHINSKIKKNIQKIEDKFPDVIQAYMDEYIITKNTTSALISINQKLKEGPEKTIFEKIVREIHSGVPIIDALEHISKSLDFFYANAFVNILKLSLTQMGDVTRELNELLNIIQNDVLAKQQTKAFLHGNVLMFHIINGITFIGIIATMIFHPFATSLYAYTSIGNTLLLLWIIQFIGGILFVEAAEKI